MYEILVELQGILQAACTTQFSKYMVGKVSYPFKMDLPFLCIYGLNTQLQAPLTTCKDRYTFSIRIDIFSNVYNYVSTAGTESDDVIKAQKSIYEKMEKRTTGQIPDAASDCFAHGERADNRANWHVFSTEHTTKHTIQKVTKFLWLHVQGNAAIWGTDLVINRANILGAVSFDWHAWRVAILSRNTFG